MVEGTRAYRRIGTRDPAAQRLARTLAATERDLTDGRNDRYLFPNLWGVVGVGFLGAIAGITYSHHHHHQQQVLRDGNWCVVE